MDWLSLLQQAGLPVVAAEEKTTETGIVRVNASFSRELTSAEWLKFLEMTDPPRHELETSRADLKAEYIATLQTLTDIENAVSPTNAQVIAAVKFLAKTLRLILKLLARMI